MQEYFQKYGNVTECNLMLDKETGKSRGFGFVTFDTEDAVEQVLAHAKEHILLGKWMDCKKATVRANLGHKPQMQMYNPSYSQQYPYSMSNASYDQSYISQQQYATASTCNLLEILYLALPMQQTAYGYNNYYDNQQSGYQYSAPYDTGYGNTLQSNPLYQNQSYDTMQTAANMSLMTGMQMPQTYQTVYGPSYQDYQYH
jgi:RNA recognition motif-containing protein